VFLLSPFFQLPVSLHNCLLLRSGAEFTLPANAEMNLRQMADIRYPLRNRRVALAHYLLAKPFAAQMKKGA